jgi:hypothetical protein
MSQEQFGRSLILEVGAKKITVESGSLALRVAFRVERDKSSVPNSCEIAVWNLSKDSREAFEKSEDQSCRLQAGYGPKVSQIFFGVTRKVETTRDGPDYITRFSAGDENDKIINALVNRTFAKGTQVYDVLAALVHAVGVGEGNLPLLKRFLTNPIVLGSGASKLDRAYTCIGGAAEELSRFCESCGLEWHVQDGKFTISRIGEASDPGQGPLISPSTGLIGEPKVAALAKKQKGKSPKHPRVIAGQITATALLLPDVVPGMPFRVESVKATGDYVAVQTKHYGDTFSKEWYVEIVGNPL